ncbi:hypothetical protein Pcinc_032261 [Petrolisthes cinctipes]|uniref:Uncharacterized protein n=1 Tax=Petrolisthes cinctipes TaxID=88211 RepID=A0AAE1EUR9_PETCI|nr:hypothetical protein Pcinc_032261 [Petrolisthes cinctipes]
MIGILPMQVEVREPYGWRLIQEFESPQEDHLLLLPLTIPTGGDVNEDEGYHHHQQQEEEEDKEEEVYLALITPGEAGEARLLQYHPGTDSYLHTGVVLGGGGCEVMGVGGYRSRNGRVFLVSGHACPHTPTSTPTSTPTPGFPSGSPSLHHNTTATQGVVESGVRVWEWVSGGGERRRVTLLTHYPLPSPTDLQVMNVFGTACVVVAGGADTRVLCEDREGPPGVLRELQRITTTSPYKLSLAPYKYPGAMTTWVLAVADPLHAPTTPTSSSSSGGRRGGGSISLLVYSHHLARFTSLQRERLEGVVWVDLVSQGPYLLLAAITEDLHGHTDGRLLIYRIELRGSGAPVPYMKLVQEVSVEEPREAHFTPSATPGKVSLYVLTRQGRITRYSATGHLHRLQWSGEVHLAGRVRMAVWRGAARGATTWGAGTAVTRLAVSGRGCSGSRHLTPPPRPALVLEERYRAG